MFKQLTTAVLFGAIVGYATVAYAANHTVIQKDKKFAEAEITVSKGDSVFFKNDDAITHNVFSMTPGMSFDLKTQKPGEASEIKFAKAGRAEVKCAIHPQMKMFVTVAE
jgi:plastocyanin